MAGKEAGHNGAGKSGCLGGLIKLVLTLILLGAVAAGGLYVYGHSKLTAAGPATDDGDPRVVVIPSGASVSRMASILESEGALTNAMHLRLAAKALQLETRLKAGEYEVPSSASLQDILDILSEGKSLLYPITIPEGLTSRAILNLLADETLLSGDLPDVAPQEGALMPDTYMVSRNTERQALIARMSTAWAETIDELWASRASDLPFDTLEEAIILASIVEKETALADERPRVAAVFVNRLRRGMRLQTDPTIIYGVCKLHPDRCKDDRLVDRNGKQRGIRQSEIAMDTGYNTYVIPALPPTPICNPGRESLAAVLDPIETKELYFVADGSGGHAFAETLAQHNRNVAAWRRIERSGGR